MKLQEVTENSIMRSFIPYSSPNIIGNKKLKMRWRRGMHI
jgi:hypothetical protein